MMTDQLSVRASAPQRAPKIGVPFLDTIQVVHGPPGLLGRFFLHLDYNLKEKGLTLEFATFEEAAAVNARNLESWAFLNPMFDPSVSDIPPDRALCFAVRNAAHEIVATASAKLFHATTRSFRDICDAGEFMSIRPAAGQPKYDLQMHAPIAATMRGDICFSGGIWVHPDVRGLRLPAMLSRIVNACVITLWNPDYILGAVRREVFGSDLFKRYGYTKAEPSYVIRKDGVEVADAILLWMTREDAIIDLAQYLDVLWPQIDSAVVARGR
jgi:hypothetical protein